MQTQSALFDEWEPTLEHSLSPSVLCTPQLMAID
jgi:hypothetical protein